VEWEWQVSKPITTGTHFLLQISIGITIWALLEVSPSRDKTRPRVLYRHGVVEASEGSTVHAMQEYINVLGISAKPVMIHKDLLIIAEIINRRIDIGIQNPGSKGVDKLYTCRSEKLPVQRLEAFSVKQ
jgi:hypothetical protein